MAKTQKAFKKFASSGKLSDTIKARRSHQQKTRKHNEKVLQRQKQRGAAKDEGFEGEDDDEDDERDVRATKGASGGRAGGVAKTVEELFGPGGLDVNAEDESDLEDLSEDEDDEETEAESAEDAEEDEGLLDEAAMKKTIKNLEKSDPEFFKYLKENDQELLDFEDMPKQNTKSKSKKAQEDVEMDSDDDEEDEDDDEEEGGAPTKTSVTMRMVKEWQNGMLKVRFFASYRTPTDPQQHSLRSLRKTLLAFRAAAHMNEEESEQGSGRDVKYTIDSAQGVL